MDTTSTPQATQASSLRLWTFLNSPFGIWLLGSIVLALVTWGFGYFSSLWNQRAERKVAVSKRYSELSLRFQVAFYEASVRVPPEARSKLTTADYVRLIEVVLGHANGQRSIAFPEFRNVPATALLSQLQYYEPGEPSIQSMITSWAHYEVRLRAFVDQAIHSPPKLTYDSGEVFHVLGYMKGKLRAVMRGETPEATLSSRQFEPKGPWSGPRIASQLATVAFGSNSKRCSLASAPLRPNCPGLRTCQVVGSLVEPGADLRGQSSRSWTQRSAIANRQDRCRM